MKIAIDGGGVMEVNMYDVFGKKVHTTDNVQDIQNNAVQNNNETKTNTQPNNNSQLMEQNNNDLAYMSQKEAEIKSGGVRTTAKAVKEGLTGVESVFCKHCGASIDSDSKFCKKCGKEQ